MNYVCNEKYFMKGFRFIWEYLFRDKFFFDVNLLVLKGFGNGE